MERFEKNIQEKLRDFQVQPPEEIWGAIENRLVQNQGKKFLWLRIAAAILLLVISITSLVLYLPSGRIAEPVAEIYVPENEQVPADSEPLTAEPGADILAEKDKTETLAATTRETYPAETLITDIDVLSDYYSIPDLLAMMPKGYENQLASQSAPDHGYAGFSLRIEESPDVTYEIATEFLAMDLKAPDSRQRGFALAAYLAPQQSFRYQRNTAPFPYEALESEIYSFAAGLKFHYNINSRWEVESGIGYNLIGQAVNGIAAFSHPSMIPLYSSKGELISSHPQSMSTSMGGINFKDQSFYFADISSSRIFALKGSYDESNVNLLNKTASGLIQHFGYIEVPIVFSYKIIDRMFSMSVKSGIAANFLYTNNVYLQGSAYTRSIGESAGISPLSWSGTGGLSFSYPVSDRVNVALEPTFTMFLTPMGQFRTLTRETYPYNYSLFMGIKYKL
ncbi:MAG: hypothetical protein K0B37_10175 [Bacteroidales bacterium]|nr:hypothetical protein [Bacteroidales bacterium]